MCKLSIASSTSSNAVPRCKTWRRKKWCMCCVFILHGVVSVRVESVRVVSVRVVSVRVVSVRVVFYIDCGRHAEMVQRVNFEIFLSILKALLMNILQKYHKKMLGLIFVKSVCKIQGMLHSVHLETVHIPDRVKGFNENLPPRYSRRILLWWGD